MARYLSPWCKERWGACIWWFDYLPFNFAKNWTAPYSDQVFHHLNLSSIKPLLFSSISGFSFLVLGPGWKIFSSTIFTLYDLSVFLSSSLHQLRGFLSIDPLSGFPPQSPITGLGGFLSVTWSFETYQLSYGARIFLLSPGFLPQSLPLEDFSLGSHSRFFFNRRLHA